MTMRRRCTTQAPLKLTQSVLTARLRAVALSYDDLKTQRRKQQLTIDEGLLIQLLVIGLLNFLHADNGAGSFSATCRAAGAAAATATTRSGAGAVFTALAHRGSRGVSAAVVVGVHGEGSSTVVRKG